MNRQPFSTNAVYHVYNRGTEKRKIFLDHADWSRFLSNLQEFNDANPAMHWKYKESEVQLRTPPLVQILAYCLMPNHYHLMLRQIHENGIPLFMQKLGTGYTNYFNQKNERSGALFQGRFKSVAVERDEYLGYLPHYIHLNPKEVVGENWRTYPWSSYLAYIGRPNPALSVDDFEFMLSLYEPTGYQHHLDEWLASKEKQNDLASVLLD